MSSGSHRLLADRSGAFWHAIAFANWLLSPLRRLFFFFFFPLSPRGEKVGPKGRMRGRPPLHPPARRQPEEPNEGTSAASPAARRWPGRDGLRGRPPGLLADRWIHTRFCSRHSPARRLPRPLVPGKRGEGGPQGRMRGTPLRPPPELRHSGVTSGSPTAPSTT